MAHEDSMGNKTEVKAGEFQIMSAGTGVFHSEINPDRMKPYTFTRFGLSQTKKRCDPSLQPR